MPVLLIPFWIVLAGATFEFYRTAKYETKVRFHPYIQVLIVVVFMAFCEVMTRGSLPVPFLAFGALIAFLNIRLTRFCPKCNATLRPMGFFRPSYCAKCGASLDVN
jgi:hypothetical protein